MLRSQTQSLAQHRRYCPTKRSPVLPVAASLRWASPVARQGQACLSSRRSIGTSLLMRPVRQRSRMSRGRAMATKAMVNVDFASPSMLLGAVLIGGGVVLLQMRNVENRVSRDADIVVAACISIVGSTLIFQGWRLDPLLLLCQALTTTVAVWYGLEAFTLRAKEPALDEDPQPPGMLPPPPPDAGAIPGSFGSFQQQYPPYQQQQQQQQPQQRRMAGMGYLQNTMRRRERSRSPSPTGNGAGVNPYGGYAGAWGDLEMMEGAPPAPGAVPTAYALPPGTAQQAYPWTAASAAPAAMPPFEDPIPLDPTPPTPSFSRWQQQQQQQQPQPRFGGAGTAATAAAAAAAAAAGGAAYYEGARWGDDGGSNGYEDEYGPSVQSPVADMSAAGGSWAAGAEMGGSVYSGSGPFEVQYDYYGRPLDPQAMYGDGFVGSPTPAWHSGQEGGAAATEEPLASSTYPYYPEGQDPSTPQTFPALASSSQYNDSSAFPSSAPYATSYPAEAPSSSYFDAGPSYETPFSGASVANFGGDSQAATLTPIGGYSAYDSPPDAYGGATSTAYEGLYSGTEPPEPAAATSAPAADTPTGAEFDGSSPQGSTFQSYLYPPGYSGEAEAAEDGYTAPWLDGEDLEAGIGRLDEPPLMPGVVEEKDQMPSTSAAELGNASVRNVGSLGQSTEPAEQQQQREQREQQRAVQGMQFEGRMDASAAMPGAEDKAHASLQTSSVEVVRPSHAKSESDASKAEDRSGSASSDSGISNQQP